MNIVKLSKNSNAEKYHVSSNIATKNNLSFDQSLSIAKRAQAGMTVDAMIKEGHKEELDLTTVQKLFGVKQNFAPAMTSSNYHTSGQTTSTSSASASQASADPRTLDQSTAETLATCTGSSYADGVLTVPDKYKDIIEEASQKYGVDSKFIAAVAMSESGFNPNEVSHSGATGIMQLMPETAKFLGVTDSYDPYQNIMGGTKYLATLLKNFNGNYALAAAGYNAGGNAVVAAGGIPNNTQTQNYVKTVMDYYQNR